MMYARSRPGGRSRRYRHERSLQDPIVAKAIRLDVEDRVGRATIEAAVERRLSAAFSEIPAERVESADWLIRESGTDAPGAIELWVAAANDGVRELSRERGWDAATAETYAARLSDAFETPLRRALVADEEKSVEW